MSFTMQSQLSKLLSLSVLGTTFLFAQPAHTPPDPAAMAARRVNRLTTLLTLTPAQQQQATTIFTTSGTADQASRTALSTARQNLNTAVKNNDVGGIEQAANTIGSLTAQMTISDSKAQASFLQILTPDQLTKYNSLGHGMMGRGFGGAAPAFHGRQ